MAAEVDIREGTGRSAAGGGIDDRRPLLGIGIEKPRALPRYPGPAAAAAGDVEPVEAFREEWLRLALARAKEVHGLMTPGAVVRRRVRH